MLPFQLSATLKWQPNCLVWASGPREPRTICSQRNMRAHIKDVFTSRMSENEQETVLIANLFIETCERKQYSETLDRHES